MGRKRATEPEPVKTLTLNVTYGNVNVGDKSASIRITFSRAAMTAAQADKALVGKRIRGRIEVLPNSQGEHADQARLFDDAVSLPATFDIDSISLKPKSFGATLNMKLGNIDVSTLAKFAKRGGHFIAEDFTDLSTAESEEAAADEESKEGENDAEDEDE